ncbi:MAG TPA: hypothetical protein VMU18_01345, partial [Rhodoblastus sp.]|nr:hypothetical protein [Rhodoblastus sp.]
LLKAPPATNDMLLTLHYRGFGVQPVAFAVNGHNVAARNNDDGDATIVASVSRSILNESPPLVQIEILTPNSFSPHSVGAGGDERNLGISLKTLSIAQQP